MAQRNVIHQSLYRALISKLDALHLEPGDFLTVTFPDKIYTSDYLLADAERFCQQVANLTKHQVIILREGVELLVKKPAPVIHMPDLRGDS
jgi:hypothetical protein